VATRTLNVQITGDSRGINRVLDQTENRSRRWGSGMAKGFAVAGAAAAGGLAVGLKKSADAAIEAEKAQATMTAQLRASGISYQAHAKQIDEVIQKHSNLSGIDDEDLQRSFTNIVRVTGDVDKSLRLTGLAADFARAKHMDVAKAGELVGKVAGGNTGILSRYGIKVKEGASAQEALALMQRKFAGQAEAYGKTTAGAMDRAGVATENMGEVIGAKLTPFLAKAATGLVKLMDGAGQLAGPMRKATGAVADGFRAAQAWVNRFRKNNKEDIDAVIDTLRNLARFARKVFDTFIDIIRPVLPHTKRIIEGIIQVIRGLIRIVTGIINGDWSRVWDGMKDIVRGALRALKAVITGSFAFLKSAVTTLGGKLVDALGDALKGLWTVVRDGIKSGVRKGVDAAKGAIGSVIGALNPFGDGMGRIGDAIGKQLGKSAFPRFGGGLMGAKPEMAPIAGLGSRFGLSVSSGKFGRENKLTSSGNVSWHSTGEALDLTGPPSAMMGFARYMSKRADGLAELIYTPLGGWSHGQRYTPTGQLARDHYDHVHVAMDVGTPGQGDGQGRIARTGDGSGVVGDFRRAIRRTNAPRKAALALFAAGIVESGLRNLSYGDADSEGALQLRVGLHGRSLARDPYRSALAFLTRGFTGRGGAIALSRGGMRAAQIAQAVQGSAYPGRYGQVLGQASRYLAAGNDRSGGGGGGGGTQRASSGGGGGGGGGAPTVTREPPEPRFGSGSLGGFEQQSATAERFTGFARRSNNVQLLILALRKERQLKRRRLARIARLLKRRLKRDSRIALIREAGQLEDEIGELTATIKEYKADVKGGAQTIEQAEGMEAGVAPDTGDGGTGGGGADAGDSALQAAMEEANRLDAERNALMAEAIADQKRLIQLTQTQGPQLLAGVIAAVNGGIGGKIGLGFSAAGVPGQLARM
jgi:hypothetical protein